MPSVDLVITRDRAHTASRFRLAVVRASPSDSLRAFARCAGVSCCSSQDRRSILGIDHTKLTHRHLGRDFRLTDVYGEVVKEIIV